MVRFMKSLRSGLVVLFVSCALPAFAQGAAAHRADDAAITKVTVEYQEAYNSHDAKAAAAFYAVDGDRRTPDGRVIQGRAAVERQLAQDFAGRFRVATVVFDRAAEIRYVSSAIAILDGSARVSGVAAPNGTPMPAARYFHTIVLVKRHGVWQILALRNWPAPSHPQ